MAVNAKPPGRRAPGVGDRYAAGSNDPDQRTTGRARVEVEGDVMRVTAPYSPELRDGMRTVGGRWVPGHWAVPIEHLSEAMDIVTDVFGPPVIDTARGVRR